MVTGPFVAQGALDQHEIGWLPGRNKLSGGCDADQQPAPRCKQLLGDQHGERCANRTADHADGCRWRDEFLHLGMVAGPVWIQAGSSLFQLAREIAIRVEETDLRHTAGR
jgi:hypothetical protein